MSCNAPKLIPYVMCEYDRDLSVPAWTEGLQWYNGYLYESTGSPSGWSSKGSVAEWVTIDSSLQQLKLENGKATVEKRFSLPFKFFGEGLARVDDKLYQLTQDSATVLVYELEPLTQLPSLPRATQDVPRRWGLCFDSDSNLFYLSDGSATLKLYDKFEDIEQDLPVGKLPVSCNGDRVAYLNDLEYANSYIYAAVMEDERSNLIVKIDSESGKVVARIDTENLRERQKSPFAMDVNGIAFYGTDNEDEQDIFFVTGKFWSKIFEVKFIDPELAPDEPRA